MMDKHQKLYDEMWDNAVNASYTNEGLRELEDLYMAPNGPNMAGPGVVRALLNTIKKRAAGC